MSLKMSLDEREKIMMMAFMEALQNFEPQTIMKKMNLVTQQDACEALKHNHDEQNHMIMKMSNELEVEAEIEMMKQKLIAAFEKIKELETK